MALQLGLDELGEERARVVASGELDAASSGLVDAMAVELVRTGRVDVVLDLRNLEFADSAGMLAVARLGERLARAGGRLAVDSPPRSARLVARILRLPFAAPENAAV